MKLRLLATTAIAFWLLPVLPAENPTSINPALLYWQAASQLPTLTEEQATTVREMARGRQPYNAAKLEGIDFTLAARQLHKAASSTAPCDWGLPSEDGPAMLLPHLSKMQELSNIACLKAEGLFAQGQTAEAIDWLLDSHRAARDVGAGGLLISFLLQLAVDENTMRAAARHCLGWDERTRRTYTARLKALPPLHSLLESYRGEFYLAEWLDRLTKLPEPERGQRIRDLVPTLAGSNSTGQAEKEKYVEAFTPESLQRSLAELRKLHQKTVESLGKSWRESRPELNELGGAAQQSELPIVKLSYPAMNSLSDRDAAAATLRTMLQAALEHGAEIDATIAATYHDAFDGAPLRVTKNGDGSITLLASNPKTHGKDIELKLAK